MCLVIQFSDFTEYAGLKYVHGSDHVLEGVLFDEENRVMDPDSHVSLTIHDDDGQVFVMIADPSEDQLFKMKVDLKTGVGQEVNLPIGATSFDDPLLLPGQQEAVTSVSSEEGLPEAGLV